MTQYEQVLLILGTGRTRPMTLADLKTAAFLLDENTDDSVFDWHSGPYGPATDNELYETISELNEQGFVRPSNRPPQYRLTEEGVETASSLLDEYEHASYARTVGRWVRSHSLRQQVLSLIADYPRFRDSSLFSLRARQPNRTGA